MATSEAIAGQGQKQSVPYASAMLGLSQVADMQVFSAHNFAILYFAQPCVFTRSVSPIGRANENTLGPSGKGCLLCSAGMISSSPGMGSAIQFDTIFIDKQVRASDEPVCQAE